MRNRSGNTSAERPSKSSRSLFTRAVMASGVSAATAASRRATSSLSPSHIAVSFEVLFEQFEDPLVLIRPTGFFDEAVILNGIDRQFPVFFTQFNQPLRETDRILEVHVDIDHAMANQQRALEPLRKIHWRALAIRLDVGLRLVEDICRVRVIVMRPVSHRPECCSGSKHIGSR